MKKLIFAAVLAAALPAHAVTYAFNAPTFTGNVSVQGTSGADLTWTLSFDDGHANAHYDFSGTGLVPVSGESASHTIRSDGTGLFGWLVDDDCFSVRALGRSILLSVDFDPVNSYHVSTQLVSEVSPAPEPANVALMGAGLVATGLYLRRRGQS